MTAITNTVELNSAGITTTTVNRNFILKVSIVAALGGLLFGFDTAIISGTITQITSYFHLDGYSLGWAVSSILIGCGLGAMMAGYFAERNGRKAVLIFCAIVFAVSGVGAGLSTSFFWFVLFRLIGGLGVGAAAMVSPMYIAEMAPAQVRGRLVALYQLAIVTGILLAYCSNYFLADVGENNWRWMFASQLIPSVLFWGMLLLVPETPRWLVKVKRYDDALQVLRKTGDGKFATDELSEIQLSFQQQTNSKLSDLLSKQYLPVVIIGVTIAVLQQVSGINAILYYAPEIFKETGLEASDSLLQTIIIGLTNVVSTFIAIGLVDKVGRKTFLMIGGAVMCASLIVVAYCFYEQYFDNYVVLIFTLLYVATFGCTLGAVTWIYLSEIFPNRIRSMAMAVATLALWLADFAVSYAFPVMRELLGTSETLMLYACFCLLSLLFVWFRVPETKGRSLEEIEKLF